MEQIFSEVEKGEEPHISPSLVTQGIGFWKYFATFDPLSIGSKRNNFYHFSLSAPSSPNFDHNRMLTEGHPPPKNIKSAANRSLLAEFSRSWSVSSWTNDFRFLARKYKINGIKEYSNKYKIDKVNL